MNGNRMKYASTPTYGMQKRSFLKKSTPVHQVPDAPDFSKAPGTANGMPFQQPIVQPVQQQPFVQQPVPQQPRRSHPQQPRQQGRMPHLRTSADENSTHKAQRPERKQPRQKRGRASGDAVHTGILP